MDMEIVFPGGKRVDAFYKGFTIETDQSKERGGDHSAPAPFDLFLVSIGTCAGMYVLDFCQTRDISVEGAKLILRTEREERTRKISKITIEILLPPGFPEKYKNAVVRSVELCSVKKLIHDSLIFDIHTRAGE